MTNEPILISTKILILEEHSLFREGLRRLLCEQEGFECVGMATDGSSALRMVKDLRPDVVIMGFVLPDMPGAEVISNIKRECPSAALIVLSHYKRFQYVADAIAAGADAYLSKSIPEVDLVSAIRLVHRGLSLFDHTVACDVIRQAVSSVTQKGLAFDSLNDREYEVLRLAAQGMSNKQIAETLGITHHTVARHLENIFGKMRVGSRTEAVLLALEKGWLEIHDIRRK